MVKENCLQKNEHDTFKKMGLVPLNAYMSVYIVTSNEYHLLKYKYDFSAYH